MKINFFLFLIVLVFSGCANNIQSNPGKNSREILNFNRNWRFHLGDIADARLVSFDDTQWRELHLPHDWSIEGDYDSTNPAGIAGAFLPTGIGIYRKNFQWEPSWEDKKVFIEFDGVYMNSTVWINGKKVGYRPYGYISFSYDLTPFLTEGKNTVVVKADHSKAPSGRWYTGSGIYRNVRLVVTNKIYVPQWGTFIKSDVADAGATVSAQLELMNETESKAAIVVNYILQDRQGKTVARSDTTFTLAKGKSSISEEIELKDPRLWSLEDPYLYKLITSLVKEGETVDSYETTLGIRSFSISPEEGFKLNGKSIKLKGVSNHHDAGPVGSAVPEDVLYRRLKLLKDMGTNAIRTTHNPFAPEFYAMCDSVGILVMNEIFDGWEKPKAAFDYGLYFEKWWQRDLEDFIKRDRNHPSIVFWSIGNEVRGFTEETQKKLVSFIKGMDITRPVTQGRGYMGSYIDIAGFNGHGENKGKLVDYHRKHPEKVLIGTELTHSYQTRGVYRTKTWYRSRDFIAPWENEDTWKKIEGDVYKIKDLSEEEVFTGIDPQYQSSYDNSLVRMGVRDYWKATKDLPYFLGAFRWTGFDYLGESFGWPARTMSFGVLDLAGFPTDQYYLYQSLWSEEPMVHMLPHWTHPGKEGVEIPVVVYTNGDSAELYLNGKSVGKRSMTDELQIEWMVPYQPGELMVVARTDGKFIAEQKVKTAGRPDKVLIYTDRTSLKANFTDVAHLEVTITDEDGNFVPYACEELEFELSGPGKFIGFENGDILDLSNAKSPMRKTFNGKLLVMVQAVGETGEIRVRVKSKKVNGAEIVLSAKEVL